MKSQLILTLVTICAIASGCTSAHFIPYTGDQDQWPVAPGAMMETVDGMPVYYGPPNKPYNVLGQLETAQRHKLAGSALSRAVSDAKKHGADAIVVRERGERYLGRSGGSAGTAQVWGNGMVTYSGGSSSHANYGETATVWLIKFRDP